MSEQGWWKLDTGDFPMEDADREHVAAAITRGITQGELSHENDEDDELNAEQAEAQRIEDEQTDRPTPQCERIAHGHDHADEQTPQATVDGC